MPDEAKGPAGALHVPALPAPETQSATQFMIAATPAELLLTIGKSRVVFNQAGQASIHVEWLSTFSLGPVGAKQLAASLNTAVAGWEKSSGLKFKIDEPQMTAVGEAPKKALKKSVKK